MFTGLIETVGTVVRIDHASSTACLRVMADFPKEDIALGDSVAVNGVCLTVTSLGGGIFAFDISPETLHRSSLRQLAPGGRVNLERALRVGDRLGGHLVTGHVDCLATVTERRETAGNWQFRFQLPRDWQRYLVAKGSVTIDGISLTVNEVSDDGFSVNIIPHTARETTLVHRRSGDVVNIETDIIGKYVERLLTMAAPRRSDGKLAELLAQSGFM
jgi:riboflavin synthase